MLRSITFVPLAAASFVLGLMQTSTAAIPIDPSAVQWSHVLLPDDQQTIIGALPTTGTIVYDNITTWRRGLNASWPQTLFYQAPGNKSEIWTSDDLHFGPGETRFNEVHFVIRTFNPDRPLSLAFWTSDTGLSWPDPAMPATLEFSLTLPEMIPSEDYATLVTVTLPFDVNLGSHVWMGLQSIVPDAMNEMIAISAVTPAVGWSDDWWSQVPGHQMQYPSFFPSPSNNFAYGLSYVVPAPSLGLPAGLLMLSLSRRRRGA